MNINDESVTTLEDLRGDLAQRHKRIPSGGSSIDTAIVDADLASLDRDGYVVLPAFLDRATLAANCAAMAARAPSLPRSSPSPPYS